MIQSSPQPHAVEALQGGPGRSRPADLKAKRNGFAGLFASLLAEARGRAESGAPKGAAAGAEAKLGSKAESDPGKGAGLKAGASIGKGKGVAATFRAARTDAGPSRAALKDGAEKTEANAKNDAQVLVGRQSASTAAKRSGDAETASLGAAEKERAELAKTRRLGLRQGPEEIAAAEQASALVGRGASAAKVQVRKGEGVELAADTKDVKKRDKRKERIDLQLYDHRSSSHQPSPDAVQAVARKDEASSTERKASSSEADLVVHLRAGNAERGDEAPRPASASSFADALARELRENANADIVKHASLVLKDGGEGLLRLSLKPDSLGAVKIRLEMADNKVAGRILVESDEALKAFEKELRSLEQAFLDGGFDGASLELGVSSDGAGRGSDGRSGDGGPRPYFSERLASSSYDATAPAADRPAASLSPDTLVNVLI